MLWNGNISWQENNGISCLHHKGEEPCVAYVRNKKPSVQLWNSRLSPAVVSHGQWQMKPSQAVPCNLVVFWTEQSHSWESLRHCAQLILSAHAKTGNKGSHCNGTVELWVLVCSELDGDHQLIECCLPLLPQNGNQCLALSIHEQSDDTILNVHMLVRKKK